MSKKKKITKKQNKKIKANRKPTKNKSTPSLPKGPINLQFHLKKPEVIKSSKKTLHLPKLKKQQKTKEMSENEAKKLRKQSLNAIEDALKMLRTLPDQEKKSVAKKQNKKTTKNITKKKSKKIKRPSTKKRR